MNYIEVGSILTKILNEYWKTIRASRDSGYIERKLDDTNVGSFHL